VTDDRHDADAAEAAPEPTPPESDQSADPTPPRRPRSTGPVQYRGADLEPARGPGLGCFRFQLIVLAVFVVLTPLSAAWHWPELVSGALLLTVIVLLLITGQTIIFLLRLVAADRRGRRRPLASETRTVGELEDAADAETATAAPDEPDTSDETSRDAAERRGPMRQ
jgi:hypothetical protein